MRKVIIIMLALISTPASAGLLGYSAYDAAKMLRTFRGQPIDTLVSVAGYPDRQEPVLDRTAYFWGEDHEEGPVCILKVVAGPDRIIVDTSAYGNIDGCQPLVKSLMAKQKAANSK